MKTTMHTENNDEFDRSMRELLLTADTEPVDAPPELIDRTRELLHRRRTPLVSKVKKTSAPKRTRRAALLTLGGAASLLAVAVFFHQLSRTSWAQVVKAVGDKSWIHFKAVETERTAARVLDFSITAYRRRMLR